MNNPALCIDVSKNTSYANPFLSIDETLAKPFSFTHDSYGFSHALKALESIEFITQKHPDVVLEATGNYSTPLVENFYQAGYNVVVLNPLETSLHKRKSIRKVKTDPRDTFRIAKVYFMNEYNYYHPIPAEILELKQLSRQWNTLNNTFVELKQKFLSTLDLTLPNYKSIFSNPCGKTSLSLLEAYPTPSMLLAADHQNLYRILKQSKRSDIWCSEKLSKLLSLAKESLTLRSAQQSLCFCIKNYIHLLNVFTIEMTDIRTQMTQQARRLPAFDILTSIPGVGEVTAITLLAEIGDINNFKTSKQLVAYAGIDPSVHQSGSYTANNSKISKRGTPYLRKAIYQATVAGISNRRNGPCNSTLYAYYTLKKSQGKPTKVAIIATCNKLLRIVHALLTKQTFYAE